MCFTPESPVGQADDVTGPSLNVDDLDPLARPNLSSVSLTASEADEENRLVRRAQSHESHTHPPSFEHSTVPCAPRTDLEKRIATLHTCSEQLAARVCAELRLNGGHAPNVFVKIATVETAIQRNVATFTVALADLQRQLFTLHQGPLVATDNLRATAELKSELARMHAELDVERQQKAELPGRLEQQSMIGEDVPALSRPADERMERKVRQIDVLVCELQTLCTQLHTMSHALDKRFERLRVAEENVKRREIVATSREAYIKMRVLQSDHPIILQSEMTRDGPEPKTR